MSTTSGNCSKFKKGHTVWLMSNFLSVTNNTNISKDISYLALPYLFFKEAIPWCALLRFCVRL